MTLLWTTQVRIMQCLARQGAGQSNTSESESFPETSTPRVASAAYAAYALRLIAPLSESATKASFKHLSIPFTTTERYLSVLFGSFTMIVLLLHEGAFSDCMRQELTRDGTPDPNQATLARATLVPLPQFAR